MWKICCDTMNAVTMSSFRFLANFQIHLKWAGCLNNLRVDIKMFWFLLLREFQSLKVVCCHGHMAIHPCGDVCLS